MSELRSHGIVRDPERYLLPVAGPWVNNGTWLCYRMTELQATRPPAS